MPALSKPAAIANVTVVAEPPSKAISTVLFVVIAVDDVTSATAPPFHPLLSLITSVFLYECLNVSLRTILLLPK